MVLAQLLKEIKDVDVEGLLGTGFDEMMLANYAMVIKPSGELEDIDAAAQWVGMPGYEPPEKTFVLAVLFSSEEARAKFVKKTPLSTKDKFIRKQNKSWTAHWPPRPKDDRISLRVQQEA